MLPWNGLTHIMLSKGHLITEFKFLQQVIDFINFLSSWKSNTQTSVYVCSAKHLFYFEKFPKKYSFSGLGLRLLAKKLGKEIFHFQ